MVCDDKKTNINELHDLMSEAHNVLKIIFFGDIVGKSGRLAIKNFLAENKTNYNFVIANVENASHGFGLTEKNYNELSEYGIDCMTSGNHIWDKHDILTFIDNASKLIRPLNYPKNTKGQGYRIFEINNNKIAVINILGKVFINVVDFQWDYIIKTINQIKEITPNIIIDFHGEATAEKICFAKFCSELGISGFLGTHTHVQTADETIINHTGYITDVGFCGSSNGVIGMEYQTSLNRFLTNLPERYEVAEDNPVQINAVELHINADNGRTILIKRINIKENNEN